MNTKKNIATLLSVFLTCLMFVSHAAYAGIAGYAQFVYGNVQVISETGQTRSLQKGAAVNEGDTVITAKDASTQIKMQDGGLVAMRPDSKLKLDSFKFNGKEDGNERVFFSLIKGGFRSITGLIGRSNKTSYRISTAVATIGIRGTDHETIVVTPDSLLASTVPSGVYNKVNVGETFMATEKGTIFVLPNQMGFAGGADQMPQLQPLNTNLFTVTTQPTSQGKVDKKEGEAVRNVAAVDPGEKAPVVAAIPLPTVVDKFVIPVCTTDPATGQCVDLTAPLVALTLPPMAGGNGVYPSSASVLGVMTKNTNPVTGYQESWMASSRLLAVNFDANGILSVANWCLGCPTPDVARITATSFEAGADSGVVSWGRWSNGSTTFGGWGNITLGPDQGFHFIVGFQTAILPTTNATARYTMISATAPTNNIVTGLTTGPVTASGFLDVNFASHTLATQMNIASGNAAFQIVGTGMIVTETPDYNMSGMMTRTGGIAPFCTTACPTSMIGSFYGVGATHSGIAYRADAMLSGGGVIDGAAVFKR